jgi:putative DNA primase/helicase
MNDDVMKMTQGRWQDILSSNGISDDAISGKHSPCPLCGGRDRFRWVSSEGKGRWICNQCRPGRGGDGMDLLMEYTGRTFKDLAAEIKPELNKYKQSAQPKKKDPRIRLNRVASGCVKITHGDPVSNYLFSRNIEKTENIYGLRYHPSMAYYHEGNYMGHYPAMVGRVITHEGLRESYHITYLSNAGEKADVPSPKKILPPVTTLNGCGCYLSAIRNNELLVAEGIETALAGEQLFGIAGVAALTAGGMEKLIIPEGVERVLILGDNDASFTGQKSAYTLANRLVREGLEVAVKISTLGDFADEA